MIIPMTYRSQRPLVDAAPLRRHKAQAIGEEGVGAGGQFLGIDRMHVAEGQLAVRDSWFHS